MIDKFGKPVKVGDKIITWLETGYGSGTTLQIVEVDKITDRLVHFKYTKTYHRRSEWRKKEGVCIGKRTSDQFVLHTGEIK